MSLIWDIVQSVERRAPVSLPQHRAGISSRRELIFSTGSEALSQQDKQQHSSIGAGDAADYKEHIHADATTANTSHPQNTASADDEGKQQKADVHAELERGNGGTEKTAAEQQPGTIQTTTTVLSKLSKAGNQSGKKKRNAKKSVQTQQVIAETADMTTSSGVQNTPASVDADDSVVADSGANHDTTKAV